jgi:hypothetical protein
MGKNKSVRTPRTIAKRAPVRRVTAADEKLVELPDGMWERISKKAYDLWVERGRPEGRDLENWLDAEAAVMDEIHEARE